MLNISKFIPLSILLILIFFFSSVIADNNYLGKKLYESRCAICHGEDARATGPLAQKSSPPTPDLTSKAFQNRLAEYPGIIVASLVFSPNKNLILGTLKEYGIVLPKHVWTDYELRAINQYILTLITKQNLTVEKNKNAD